MTDSRAPIHLRSAGVSVIIACDPEPRILHWGGALDDSDIDALDRSSTGGQAYSSFDLPRIFPLLPRERSGWSGRPCLAWHRGGQFSDPSPRLGGIERPDAETVVFRYGDAAASVDLTLRLDTFGILHHTIRVSAAAGADPLDLLAVRAVLPVPAEATEILDFTGRWTRERSPQRQPLGYGAHVRENRRGRTGHDSAFVMVAGTPGFGFRAGRVWAAHTAWSGNSELAAERLPEGAGVHGAALSSGELLLPGEIRLAPGESYTSPETLFVFSASGLDGLSARVHRALRSQPAYPSEPRPLVLNTWEAVYFDHDPARLSDLARLAASVGVERFVLDDGWFVGRPDDRSGLGDWVIDPSAWPEGLRPLADLVHGLGMQFGLWFEPEMVNPESLLAREHPDWILTTDEDPALWRHQLVLDLTRPEAWVHILTQMDAVITQTGVDFIKWDHNRDLHAAVSRATGRASVHAQVEAVYALMDELHRRHPSLEIESCASGGGRVDLGVLEHTQRVWASDTNDPIERQTIQRWTGLLLPPELVGSHIGPERAHTTHRSASLGFRMATALFGHAGIEWDLAECTAGELDALRAWSALYRELRPLLHTGTTVRADLAGDGSMLHGVVAADAGHAVFAWVQLATGPDAGSMRVPIPGLDPAARYLIRERDELGSADPHQVRAPSWLEAPLSASGAMLAESGLPLPVMNPGSALLLEFIREPA